MFEDYTYELLLADVLANAPGGVDTRQGSIFYDAVSGILIKIAKLYTDLELVFELTQIDTTTGEYLDKKASEYGIIQLRVRSTISPIPGRSRTPGSDSSPMEHISY